MLNKYTNSTLLPLPYITNILISTPKGDKKAYLIGLDITGFIIFAAYKSSVIQGLATKDEVKLTFLQWLMIIETRKKLNTNLK